MAANPIGEAAAAIDRENDPVRPNEIRAHPIVRFAVQRRVTMGMLVLGVLVLGTIALSRLPLEYLPTISSSSVSIQIPYPGSSPEETTRAIVRPLEDSLGTLNGLDRLSSTASATDAYVNLEFVAGTDMDLAAVEVRDRVDRVRHRLPSDIREVRIRRFQSTDLPVLRMHLSAEWNESEGGLDRLYRFAERELVPRIERIEGVAQVEIRGLRKREVQIRLDADRMAAHGVSLRGLAARLRANHLDVSAGTIVEGSRKQQVRVLGELRSLDQIRDLPLGDGDQTGLRLADVAEVAYTYPRQTSFDYLNGTESLNVRIYKASNANLLEVVDRSKKAIAAIELDPRWAGLKTRIYRDASTDVRKGLRQLRDAGLFGGGLAILAVFLFLRRLRTTLLVAIAIPVSVVFTFVILYAIRQLGISNITLNVVSLMGLVLALGMLVDSSIVVIEAIYRRHENENEDPETAALHGASEVAMPIIASTATTLCVFVPTIFLRGSSGFFARYLTEIGTTICIVMIASLIVALTVVPMSAALLLRRESARSTPFIVWLGRVHEAVVRRTLRFRLAFVLLSIGLLYGSWWLFGSIERSFGGRAAERQITINVDVPRAFSLDQTRALFESVYALLDARRDELDLADMTYSYHDGGGRSRGRSRGKRFELHLVEEEEASRTLTEVRDAVRAMMPVMPGVTLKIDRAQHRWGGSGLEIELAGDDVTVLELIGRRVAARVAEVEGVEDVDLSLESGDDEIHVRVARDRALRNGLSSEVVAGSIQSALSDRALGQLHTEDGEIDLIVQYREEDRQTLSQLRNVPVGDGGDPDGTTATGRAARSGVPLESLATFEQRAGPASIERENRRSKLRVSANASSPRSTMMAMRGIGSVMASAAMPPGYTWSFGRWNRIQQQDQAGSAFALLFAAVLVYMLMAALFESFTHPFCIMISVPFAFLGVGVAMKLAGQPRDNLTELGFLILVGVVVNNAIILIDHINRLRRDGHGREQAILLGGRHRLRAILMTAVTTILGLLPMVAPIFFPEHFGSIEGRAGNWAPVGLVILGGLTTSTFLTLVFIPIMYSLVDDLTGFLRRVARTA